MDLRDCLSVGLQARQGVVTQWVAYIGLITFVISGLVLGKDPVPLSLPLQLLGTAAFVLFDAVNLRGLVEVYRLLQAMTEEAKAVIDATPLKSPNVKTLLSGISVGDRVPITYVVHTLIGLAVLTVIWSDTVRNGARALHP